MKKILYLVLLFMMLSVPNSDSAFKIIGVSVECDTSFAGCIPIPLSPTLLCSVSCSNLTSPSFTDSNRFWGTIGTGCRTSLNGGMTWVACTTQPLSSGAQEQYAGAEDGSVIAIGQVATTCTVKRSTDNGANWTTVYTAPSTAIICGGAISGGSRLKCLSDGRCTFATSNGSTNFPVVLESEDNGQTWVSSSFGSAGTNPISFAWNGGVGIGTANTLRSLKYTAGSWGQGAAGFAGCGTISGSVVYNSAAYGLCKDPTVASTAVRLMTPDGVLFKTLTLPGAQTGVGVGILAFGWATNVIYVVTAVNTSPQALGVWVSKDNGASFTLIYQTPTTTNSMQANSDIFAANGCIYFSGGVSAVFVKIC